VGAVSGRPGAAPAAVPGVSTTKSQAPGLPSTSRPTCKKGITLGGIFGRRLSESWEQLLLVLPAGRLDLDLDLDQLITYLVWEDSSCTSGVEQVMDGGLAASWDTTVAAANAACDPTSHDESGDLVQVAGSCRPTLAVRRRSGSCAPCGRRTLEPARDRAVVGQVAHPGRPRRTRSRALGAAEMSVHDQTAGGASIIRTARPVIFPAWRSSRASMARSKG
jgi:hypothetical protein